MNKNVITLSDLGNKIIKIHVEFFNINIYIHYDYLQSYIDMIKTYYQKYQKE